MWNNPTSIKTSSFLPAASRFLPNTINSTRRITTFSGQLDRLLGGGIRLNCVTEICGVPGIGKTQLCLQLCVDVQIPWAFGGLQGTAIYIDTDVNFTGCRVQQIALATSKHLHDICEFRNEPLDNRPNKLTTESILDGIQICKINEYKELLVFIHQLDDIIYKMDNVRLLVIDSLASLFRHSFTDYRQRTKILSLLSMKLQTSARKHKIAIVVVNQMTHRFIKHNDNGELSQKLVPCLGDRWLINMTYRIIMYWKGEDRLFELVKGGDIQAFIKFQITFAGIRDLTMDAKRSRSIANNNLPPAKKLKTK